MPLALLEVVLPLLLCLASKLDGMVWTMMIAAEAGEAILVVQPGRHLSFTSVNIADRTDVGTDAAFHTFVLRDMETLVGNENLLEETTYDLGEEPRDGTFHQSVDSFLSIEDFLTDNLQFQSRFLLLPYLFLLRIDIHERQSYVRLWHNQRIGGRDLLDSDILQGCIGSYRVVEVLYRQSDAVASRADSVCKDWLFRRSYM